VLFAIQQLHANNAVFPETVHAGIAAVMQVHGQTSAITTITSELLKSLSSPGICSVEVI